ncbi:type II secretion system F family protein [Streptacidiphilus carbonis]|uniref:type II secretion system F family protein n=1 Tax=Streptacidiphilus carbonis TaxID=105422 RepID=UPI000A978045|nr:type II secretion system F family protein [Streptacidiphilus carbonis]
MIGIWTGTAGEWAGTAAGVLGVPTQVLRATAAGALLCLLGWGAWRLAERDVTRRRQVRLFPRSHRPVVHRLGTKLRAGGRRPPPELLLLPLGVLAAWPTHSPLVAAVAAGAVLPAIRLRRRRGGARLAERRRRAVVGLCAALAGELRTGATPHQAVETAVSDGTVPDAQALDCTVLLAAVRYGGGVPEAFQTLAEVPGAEGAAGIAACWQVSSSSGAGLADGLDRVAEGLRAERSLGESIQAELAGPRSTAGLLAALPLFGLLLGIALGADPLRMLLHTPSGLLCLFGGALLEWAGLAWTARIARGAEAVPA